jgi:mono/diheme cytochrome c family protein
MTRNAWFALLFLTGFPHGAFAQHDEHLTETQQLGRRIYEQSCAVCHTRPTLVSTLYGPELSKDSAGGNEEVMRGVITDGTPRMPGFKYTYDATQIAAIAAYLKTLEPGHQGQVPR